MKRTALLLALLPTLGLAQVGATAHVGIDLPVVLPPLVVVSPGIRVVPESEHEVFYTNGYYWARYDGGWYRSRSHRGGWVIVPDRRVPPGLVRLPPGQYRHWKPEHARYDRWERNGVRHERVVEVRDTRDRHDRRDHHDNGRGRGKGHDKHGDGRR
jgi:hypothetical protein